MNKEYIYNNEETAIRNHVTNCNDVYCPYFEEASIECEICIECFEEENPQYNPNLVCRSCECFMESFHDFTGNPSCEKNLRLNREKNSCLEVVWK